MIVTKPHALYFNGELIGVILNPDPCPGGINDLVDHISPDEGLADAVAIPTATRSPGWMDPWWDMLEQALDGLGVQAAVETEEDWESYD